LLENAIAPVGRNIVSANVAANTPDSLLFITEFPP